MTKGSHGVDDVDGHDDSGTAHLGSVAVGGTAVVTGIASGPGGLGRRLADLGFLPGTTVRVVRRAPLGDPTVYELRGYQLCLRRSEAARVEIAVVAAVDTAVDAAQGG